jgi:hypothetical protein
MSPTNAILIAAKHNHFLLHYTTPTDLLSLGETSCVD